MRRMKNSFRRNGTASQYRWMRRSSRFHIRWLQKECWVVIIPINIQRQVSRKRFWFSAFGYTDVILKAGKVWNKVPFPLLIIPNANLSYTIQPESYSLMNAMEFMNDEYASWDVTYYLNGFLFNRVPLLKKLKWREVLSFRGLYGNLSDKNNPTVSNDLFRFPVTTSYMGDTPYMEVGIGVENILKVLRFDYVWRLTYRNLPGIDKSGLRISLHMTF